MQIKQFEDKNLSHFSYAILSDCEKKIVLVDPARDPQPYLDYAKDNGAEIIGVIETHPHADFVSSHAELAQLTGATLYTSKLVGVAYAHQGFDEGDSISFGKIKLTALNTPGHSPDSISIVLDHDGKTKAVFTGDTLFIGDCGRPDLREKAGNLQAKREELASQMYHSLRNKLLLLADEVQVYPAHGAGSLCGKALSEAHSSTMGAERISNWSLQPQTEEEFVKKLLADQPFIPAYFPYDVELNRQGAPAFKTSVKDVEILGELDEKKAGELATTTWIVDARSESVYKKGHLPRSVNLMENGKFETWLGSIIHPDEKFYLAGADKEQLERLIKRAAAIGYESKIEKAFVLRDAPQKDKKIDLGDFRENMEDYTIVDVRNRSEIKEGKPFKSSIEIPLPELRGRVKELPTDKPVVVHCAGGYRSAAASSIISSTLQNGVAVYDLGEAIRQFN